MAEPLAAELLRSASAIVDVRSPAEFAKGAIAGAVNIPLFQEGERAEIGTIYKQRGKKEAVAEGLRCVGGRLGALTASFETFRGLPLLVYCARGGMRSAAVVSLLQTLGYSAQQLVGGYQAYRHQLPAALTAALPSRLLVLYGQTGVGKTLLLQHLRKLGKDSGNGKARSVLDLEALAGHRGSLFGAINMQPRTQQQFEAGLLVALQELEGSLPVWIEGESRRIGNIALPSSLYNAMRAASPVLVTASLETRVERIIAEYGGRDAVTVEQLKGALIALTPFLGKKRIEEIAALLDSGEMESVVKILLQEHYDPRYRHAMRAYQYVFQVSSDDLEQAAYRLQAFAEKGMGKS